MTALVSAAADLRNTSEASYGEKYVPLHMDLAAGEGTASASDPGGEGRRGRCDSLREILDDPESSQFAHVLHCFLVVIISLSTACAIIETVPDLPEMYRDVFKVMEQVFTVFFTVEILLRLCVSGSLLAYLMVPSNIVDILSTLPWYLEMSITRLMEDDAAHRFHMEQVAGSFRTFRMVRMVRMIRLLRLLRMAKAARHSEMISLVVESISDSLDGICVLMVFVSMGAIVAATLVYFVESDVPGSEFSSVPASMWWSMATITTVGYGDVVPATVSGKAIACGTMVGGMIIVSVSVAVITTSFTESYQRRMNWSRIKRAARRSEVRAAENPHSPEAASPWTASARGDRMQHDVVRSILHLEEETKQALARLEGLVLLMQGSVGESPLRGTSILSSRSPAENAAAKLSSVTMEALQDQCQTFFKSATALAEHVAHTEAELRGAAANAG